MTLAFLDECGFSPSQPVNSSWPSPGVRKDVPCEHPCNRRVNALSALLPAGPAPPPLWDGVPRPLTGADLLLAIQQPPRQHGRRVAVLDNASIHVSRLVRDALPAIEEQGIELYYLPAYSPELNAIEPVFGGVKHHGLPARRSETVAALIEAVDAAFAEAEKRLLVRCQSLHQLRPAG